MRVNVAALLLLSVGGCAVHSGNQTIRQLDADKRALTDLPLPQVSHQRVRNEYRALLELVEETELREQIERRIAGVYMLEGDHQLLVGTPPAKEGNFAPAIKSYNEVVSNYPNSADNAESLYQMAKGYDLDGKDVEALQTLDLFIAQYPTSPRIAEAYFRKGDIHFRHDAYAQAESAYLAVIALGGESAFLSNSYYLLGWSRYKQSNYNEGLRAFSEVLDRLIPEDGQIEKLDKVPRSLVDDTLRIMSLSLAHQGGAERIKQLYADRPRSSRYLWLLYAGLGKHFLEKERYEDSATSYRAFVLQNPESERAPEMHSEMIRAYIDGDFVSQVLPEKERYVALYGIASPTWASRDEGARAKVLPNLKTYLDELAQHYHGTGQQLKKAPDAAQTELQIRGTFLKAAGYYQQYLDTFPNTPRAVEMGYMRAEALFDGGDYVAAIEAYEQTAYVTRHPKHGADAGYATIIAYQQRSEELATQHGENSPELTEWRAKAVAAQLRFVENYRADSRSAAVLAKASEELFVLKRYEQARELATRVVSGEGKVDRKLHLTAYGVIAHSQYALGNYAEAETGYRQQLNYVAQNAPERARITERMATAAYKQGEIALKGDDPEQAVSHFLRIKRIAPNAEARVAAQYDAATYLLKLARWQPALTELRELQALFPNHPLAKELPQKIAFAYEQNGQWIPAAEAYMAIYRKSPSEDARRDALFLAAGLYEKAGENERAIDLFKRWAHAYEEPFDNRMEARYHLALLYKKQEDMVRHLYWLRRVIDGDKEAGGSRTDRSQWLAAWAHAEYGDYWTWEFKRIPLRAPIDKWMPKKSEKLKNALDRYEAAAGYGVFDISTRAAYGIGELYARFARELMASPRPPGLNKVERQQYELLLEEQAIPFEELAIEIHQNNVTHAWNGEFNEWVGASYTAMAKLLPARFDKQELKVSYGDGIR